MSERILLLEEALRSIADYNYGSFRVAPKRCMPFIMAFMATVEKIYLLLLPAEAVEFNRYLNNVLHAIEAEDYVMVRDNLVYKIKPLLVGVLTDEKEKQ